MTDWVIAMVSGPGSFTTFAYYFGMTAVFGCIAASNAMAVPYNHPIAVQAGLLLGSFAGIGGALFNRSVNLELTLPKHMKGRRALRQQLEQALADLFFEAMEVAREDGVKVYERPMGSWLSGRLYVQEEAETVRVVGRASTVRKLKAKL